MASRREARERALELLYEAQAKSISVEELLGALPLAPDPYVVEILRGVWSGVDDIDRVIASHLRHDWVVERLAVVERLILRVATWELLERRDLPTAVILSEAVELAKRYGTDKSSGFVNGVLAAISGELRPPATTGL